MTSKIPDPVDPELFTYTSLEGSQEVARIFWASQDFIASLTGNWQKSISREMVRQSCGGTLDFTRRGDDGWNAFSCIPCFAFSIAKQAEPQKYLLLNTHVEFRRKALLDRLSPHYLAPNSVLIALLFVEGSERIDPNEILELCLVHG